MSAMKEQKLTPDIRNEIVRDLVTHMYGFAQKPSNHFVQVCCPETNFKIYVHARLEGNGICK